MPNVTPQDARWPRPYTVPAPTCRKPGRRRQRRPVGLLAVCLSICLCSCARQPVAPTPEVVKVTPPAGLLLDTPIPPCAVSVNEDMVECILGLVYSIGQCNADKRATRTWAQP